MKRSPYSQNIQSILDRYEQKPMSSLDARGLNKVEHKFRISKKKHKIQRSISHSQQKKQVKSHTFSVSKGNNHQIIESILESQDWQPSAHGKLPSLIWVQDSRKVDFNDLAKSKILVNAFEQHYNLTNKQYLYANMKKHCETQNIPFDFMPISFSVNFAQSAPFFIKNLQSFLRYYLNPKQARKKSTFQFQRQGKNYSINLRELECNDKSQSSIWILKPTNKNRGTGIKLFNKLKFLEEEFSQSLVNFSMYSMDKPQQSYIIQKYIQEPYLIDGRKFDIRVWTLVDQHHRVYFFRQGYLRLSSEIFSLNKDQLNNAYVHLTNNAIQKNGNGYGKYEEGNQWSFQQFQQFLNGKMDFKLILGEIRRLARLTHQATMASINPKNRKNCFQLFGFDFLLDSIGKVWLIEVNHNPCLEESSELLRKLLPRMLTELVAIVDGEYRAEGAYFEKL